MTIAPVAGGGGREEPTVPPVPTSRPFVTSGGGGGVSGRTRSGRCHGRPGGGVLRTARRGGGGLRAVPVHGPLDGVGDRCGAKPQLVLRRRGVDDERLVELVAHL